MKFPRPTRHFETLLYSSKRKRIVSWVGAAREIMRLLRFVLGRAHLLSLLGLLGAVGWAFVAWMTLDMGHPWVMLMMPTSAQWQIKTTIAVLLMWAIMMVAMMLPAASPMISLFDLIESRKPSAQAWRLPAFMGGYLAVWVGFAVLATALQWSLQGIQLVTPMAESSSTWLTSALLLTAGLYQFSALKYVCLRFCQSPVFFLMKQWRPGIGGAYTMGVEHGAYCLGCCWALMLLLFVAGAMNLIWIAALTAVVLAEKLLP